MSLLAISALFAGLSSHCAASGTEITDRKSGAHGIAPSDATDSNPDDQADGTGNVRNSNSSRNSGSAHKQTPPECGPSFKVHLRDGSTTSSRFQRDGNWLVSRRPLASVSRLETQTPAVAAPGLPRLVSLWTGETFPAVTRLLPASTPDSRKVEFLWSGLSEEPFSCDVDAVAGIAVPAGCRDLHPRDVHPRDPDPEVPSKPEAPATSGESNREEREPREPREPRDDRDDREPRTHRLEPAVHRGFVELPLTIARPNEAVSGNSDRPMSRIRFHFQSAVASEQKASSDSSDSSGDSGEAAGSSTIDVRYAGGIFRASATGHATGHADGHAAGHARVRTQPLRRKQPEFLRLFIDDGLVLQVDDALLATSEASFGKLIAVETMIEDAPTDEPFPQSLTIAEPRVRIVSGNRTAAWSPRFRHPARQQDSVSLHSGDELFGRVTKFGARHFLLHSPRDIRIPRDRVISVTFAAADRDEARRDWLSGVAVRLDLVPEQSCSLTTHPERFWIRGTIVRAEDAGLRIDHPLLGRNRLVDWRFIRRITPLFDGSSLMIDAGPRHPGNGYRDGFQQVEPDGTRLEYRFSVPRSVFRKESDSRAAANSRPASDTRPASNSRPASDHRCFLSADIAELIPSGPETLQAIPLQEEVRNGFLATEVFLNGQRIGSLNSAISVRAPAESPERVRLPLPGELLNSGANVLAIQQTPARNDPMSFDDFEFRSLAVEVTESR